MVTFRAARAARSSFNRAATAFSGRSLAAGATRSSTEPIVSAVCASPDARKEESGTIGNGAPLIKIVDAPAGRSTVASRVTVAASGWTTIGDDGGCRLEFARRGAAGEGRRHEAGRGGGEQGHEMHESSSNLPSRD